MSLSSEKKGSLSDTVPKRHAVFSGGFFWCFMGFGGGFLFWVWFVLFFVGVFFEKNKVAYFLWEIKEDVRSHSV